MTPFRIHTKASGLADVRSADGRLLGFVLEDPAARPRNPASTTPPRSWLAYTFDRPRQGGLRPSAVTDPTGALLRFPSRRAAAAAVAARTEGTRR